MWDVIQDILINVLLIVFPVLFYLVFLRESLPARRNKWFSKFTAVLLFSLTLTILFPASYSDFTYDLRIIPIIVAYLYGGALPGILLITSMLILTFLLDPSSLIPNVLNYLLVSIILTKFKDSYHRQPIQNKVITISIFYFIIALSRIVYVINSNHAEQLSFLFYLTIITWITLLSVIFIIENMESQLIMQSELEHYEKMNTVSQLAAAVAHEIRNPMTTVRGFLQMLGTSHNISPIDKSYITISIEELDRAQSIINEYLSISKPQKMNMESFNLTEVLHNSIQIISAYAAVNNIHITSEIDPDLYLYGHKHEIQQVLMNLMKNGIEAMEGGKTLEVFARENPNGFEINIKDEGCGIAEEDMKWLGTAYYSNKEGGTGLGLAVTYEIIKRMKGKIDVKSKLNSGTTFTLLFPK